MRLLDAILVISVWYLLGLSLYYLLALREIRAAVDNIIKPSKNQTTVELLDDERINPS